MGTRGGVHMKGVCPWLVRWAFRAGTRDFRPALAALVGPVQNIFSQYNCPHCPASWEGSRAGSPVS
jgi:hypothetical protein